MIDFSGMQKIALFSHVRPDGDTLGAMFGLCRVLTNLGRQVDCFCDGMIPDDLKFLDSANVLNQQTCDAYDACIALDCAERTRLGAYESLFFSVSETYNIDHHMTNPLYAKHNVVEESASTCEIVYELLQAVRLKLDSFSASCFYVGIVTDTGSFSQSNTTAHAHLVAAALMNVGVDVEEIHNRVMKIQKREKLMLIADRIRALRFFADGEICVMTVSLDNLNQFGLTVTDTEGLVNYALNIEGVKIAACVMEFERHQYKISLRCRKGYNVAAVASSFGGGGHIQAAGCACRGLLEEVLEKIVRYAEIALEDGRNR